MSDAEKRFHETWLGMVQPIEGLVVSVPALIAAECMERQGVETQRLLHELCPDQRIADAEGLDAVLEQLLGFDLGNFDRADALPEDLSLYVAEGQQTIRPTMALRKLGAGESDNEDEAGTRLDDSTPASRAGAAYTMLVWHLPDGPEGPLDFDKAETVTGPWHYPPAAKLDRLLRECRVPIGLLVNGPSVRLMYCLHGESSGAMTFHIADMAEVGGRPILDAFVMLLHEFRWFGVDEERSLPALLADSRARQADVTDALADQLFEALSILLAGFEAAGEREVETAARLREALDAREGNQDQLYGGLLTLLLRLVFLLYAEDRDLMPMDHPTYGAHLSLLALHDELQADAALFPDTMGQRFGAYPRLLAAFRAVFFGLQHGDLYIPPRHGALFDPERYPFLEGWGPGGGAPVGPDERAELRVPSISDDTVYRVLERLLILGGQRLSYRALEVEQIGSVYEALMGYHVHRVPEGGGPAVCLRPARVWVTLAEVLAVAKGQRVKWLQARGLSKAQATKLNKDLGAAKTDDEALEVLRGAGMKKVAVAGAGRLVIQPGEERRRTSSHYTPRSLSEPIVARTLEPLIAAMDDKGEPSSEKLLRLKVCDPAMGSGAFLVAAVRFLADQVVAAWTREGVLAEIVEGHEDPVMYARRLVAQRCIYGVDKNPFAVNLAKLSLWLETLARDEPFTFVDHALKCGDSLVGLDLQKIKEFDWGREDEQTKKKGKKKTVDRQLGLFDGVIEKALLKAYAARRRLLELAGVEGDRAELTAQKEALHEEAELALERARMIGDCVLGAFFAHGKDKARRKELAERRGEVESWLMGGADARVPVKVRQWVEAIREEVRPFHWWLEFPEVFWDERADPLDGDIVNSGAWLDAVIGNPPFLGGSRIWPVYGAGYRDFLLDQHEDSHANGDLCAHFFRRCHRLLSAHGMFGLIATNTVSQGDTRSSGLQAIMQRGAAVVDATTDLEWGRGAAVTVTVVVAAIGEKCLRASRPLRLNGVPCDAISSRLRMSPERPDPVPLSENDKKSHKGAMLYGEGFVLDPAERHHLVHKNRSNAEVIFPYLGGEEINSSPTQASHRYAINLGDRSLEEAENWPDIMDIVRERVKPVREKLGEHSRQKSRKVNWWKYGTSSASLEAAIAGLPRYLVTARITKHLAFSFQPAGVLVNDKVYVFTFSEFSYFSVLQSRLHGDWTCLLSSTLSTRLNYSATDCFKTFPFPPDSQLTPDSPLEAIGERLYKTRAQYMIDTDQGLTKTYNALKDPEISDTRIVRLRDLHLEMDRQVLAAYGWSDIEVPPYTDPVTPAEKAARQAFEDEIIDRLFVLNAERAAEEAKLGTKKAKKTKPKKS